MNNQVSKIHTPLRWAGGKRWLAPFIRPIWNKYSNHRFVEPFCGGLGLTFELLPEKALLNDINTQLINFLRWLKTGLIIEDNFEFSSDAYYRNRKRFNELISDHKNHSKEAAFLFYYLNKTCFNGLCRFNRSGEFNVPYGQRAKVQFEYNLSYYAKYMENWIIIEGSYENLEILENDFLFIDPPYDVPFRDYFKDGFIWEDQERLAEWVSDLRVPVILCNHATDRITELYNKYHFNISYLEEQILISANGNRQKSKMILATKNIVI